MSTVRYDRILDALGDVVTLVHLFRNDKAENLLRFPLFRRAEVVLRHAQRARRKCGGCNGN